MELEITLEMEKSISLQISFEGLPKNGTLYFPSISLNYFKSNKSYNPKSESSNEDNVKQL